MKDGVIADFEVTEKMLQHFIRKAHNGRSWVSPRVVIGVPGEITQVSAARSKTRPTGPKHRRSILSPKPWPPPSERGCQSPSPTAT
jgi:rod shape-determining protein MreB